MSVRLPSTDVAPSAPASLCDIPLAMWFERQDPGRKIVHLPDHSCPVAPAEALTPAALYRARSLGYLRPTLFRIRATALVTQRHTGIDEGTGGTKLGAGGSAKIAARHFLSDRDRRRWGKTA